MSLTRAEVERWLAESREVHAPDGDCTSETCPYRYVEQIAPALLAAWDAQIDPRRLHEVVCIAYGFSPWIECSQNHRDADGHRAALLGA